MSFATNLAEDIVKSHIMAVIRPKATRGYPDWQLYSGDVYYLDFDYGPVYSAMTSSNVEMTEVTSIAACDGSNKYYYSATENRIYRYIPSTPDALTPWIITITFELYFSTHEVLWYQDPTDSTTDLVQWTSNIIQPPDVSISCSDQLTGVLNSFCSNLSAIYDPSKYQKLLYDAGFKNCDFVVWQIAGDLKATNIQKIYTGAVGDKISTDLKAIEFEVIQKGFDFDQAFETRTIDITADSEVFGDDANGKVIRFPFGASGSTTDGDYIGMIPINSDFDNTTPGTSDNRDWIVGWDAGGDMVASFNANGTNGSDTSSKIFSTADAKKFYSGRYVHVHNTGAGTHKYTRILSIDTGSGEIGFEDVIGLGAVTVYQYFVDVCYMVQGTTRYTLKPGRDFTCSISSSKILMSLTTSAESNVSASTFNPASDHKLVCVLAPKIPIPTIGGSAFDTLTASPLDQTYIDGTSHIIGLYYFLKSVIGIAEADIDTDSFIAAYDASTGVTGTIGKGSLTYPFYDSDGYVSYKEVILDLLALSSCILYFDESGKYAIKYVGDTLTSSNTIDFEDIISGSLGFEFTTEELSYAQYSYKLGDANIVTGRGFVLLGQSATNFKLVENATRSAALSIGSNAIRHYNLSLQNKGEIDILPPSKSRTGRITFQTHHKFSSMDIGSTITLQSKFLPGFAYDADTDRTRDYVIVEIKKNIHGVTIVADDLGKYLSPEDLA